MPRVQFVTVVVRKREPKLLAVFKTPEEALSASLAVSGSLLQLYHEPNIIEISPSHPNYNRWFKMAQANEAWVVDPLIAKATGK